MPGVKHLGSEGSQGSETPGSGSINCDLQALVASKGGRCMERDSKIKSASWNNALADLFLVFVFFLCVCKVFKLVSAVTLCVCVFFENLFALYQRMNLYSSTILSCPTIFPFSFSEIKMKGEKKKLRRSCHGDVAPWWQNVLSYRIQTGDKKAQQLIFQLFHHRKKIYM